MAITTLDGLLAGMLPSIDVVKASFGGEAAGWYHSSWYLAGMPGAGVLPTSGLGGATLTGPAVPGQITVPAAVAGKNVYLARMDAVQAANIGGFVLADRIWANNGLVVTTTGAQTVNSVAWDRDSIIDGNFTGEGVQVALEVTTSTTNGAVISNMSMSYTNSDGTAGRTATVSSFPATAAAGTFVPFLLQAGDRGVRSIQTITLGTSLVTGAVSAVAFRQIVSMGTPSPNVVVQQGPADLGLPRLHDNSVPFLIFSLTGGSNGVTDCGITWTQG